MKRKILVILLMTILISGCGKSNTVENYPGADNSTVTSQEEASGDVPANQLSPDNIVSYVVMDSRGKAVYEINAEKVGDESEAYPVVSIDYPEFTDQFVTDLVNTIFDRDSVSMIMPYGLANPDYVNDRIQVLEDRKQRNLTEGKEDYAYIEKELDQLHRLIDRNQFGEKETLSCPDKPSIISLKDYYNEKGMDIGEINFCYLEGTIGGEYYRLDLMTLMNTRSVTLYREQSNDSYAEAYIMLEDEENAFEETEGESLTRQMAENQFSELLEMLHIGDMLITDSYAANVIGNMEKQGFAYQKPGFVCFASANIAGRTFPTTQLTTYYSSNTLAGNSLLASQYISELFVHPEFLTLRDWEKYTGSEIYYHGYTSAVGCYDNRGLVELCITNIMDSTGKSSDNTGNTPMISFEEANERAKNYLTYLAEHPVEGATPNSIKHSIYRIELAMCRVIENDHYYLVPAWYYLQEPENNNVLPVPAVVVNAIDGSIIDLELGGQTIEF